MRAGAVLIVVTVMMLAATIVLTLAHDAPSGWSYPYSCCSDEDCRPVADETIGEGPNGYVVKATGEIVPYQDPRIRSSPDGVFHRCSIAGADDARTICLFVPPRAF